MHSIIQLDMMGCNDCKDDDDGGGGNGGADLIFFFFPSTCDIPSARKWLFKVEMADALEVQSFPIQRLVGLLLAESPVITGSQPKGRGCKGGQRGCVDHCPGS